MDEMYVSFCKNIHSRLKDTVNASVNCVYIEDTDSVKVSIGRLGIQYETYIKDVTDIIKSGEDGIEKCFTKLVKNYRNWINHKFFY